MKDIVLDVKVLDRSKHFIVIQVPQLEGIAQVRRYPSKEQQIQAITTAVREAAWGAITVNVLGLEEE